MKAKLKVFLAGLVFAGAGLFIYLKSDKEIKVCTEQTVGVVVEIRTDVADEDKLERPIISYSVNGVEYRHESPLASGNSRTINKYRTGEQVTIYYDPTNPKTCYMEGNNKKGRMIGLVFSVIGVLIMVLSYKSKEVPKDTLLSKR